MRPTLLAAAAGYVLVLAFPPVGIGALALPAVAAFLTAIRLARRPGEAWAAGVAFGGVFFGFLFPWLAELGVIALVPLVVVQGLFPTVYARAMYRARHRPPGEWVLIAAAGWGAMEYVRERFPLGGFGWGMAGYPVGEYAWLRHAAQWIGTSGWSVVVALAAATVAVVVTERRVDARAAIPFALIATLGLGGALLPPRSTGESVDVVLVQGSSPCPGQRCPGERAATYAASLELTSRIEPGSADLVVWPEGSTGFNVDPILDPAVGDAIAAEAARIEAVLLVGGDRPVSDTEWINANVVWDRDGELMGEYRKRHPVPFGEYVPARPMFAWIPDLSRVPRDMIRGDGPELFEIDGGLLGSVISFESSFARYSRDHVRAGAGLLVVATSQASYPYSDASDQLIGMTRMRSAELGVDVVHGSVTGRSTFITDGGAVGEKTGLAEITALAGTVQFRADGPTLYTRLGDWVQLVGMAWLLDRSVRSRLRSGRTEPTPTEASAR
ncbi:MAG TPA: apolipoprotein N-acyltransferase [Acidimicrobiia bacterium]|nr:apolipoprotein N-acyltransferase [Acidimicrobiia bacterium]